MEWTEEEVEKAAAEYAWDLWEQEDTVFAARLMAFEAGAKWAMYRFRTRGRRKKVDNRFSMRTYLGACHHTMLHKDQRRNYSHGFFLPSRPTF